MNYKVFRSALNQSIKKSSLDVGFKIIIVLIFLLIIAGILLFTTGCTNLLCANYDIKNATITKDYINFVKSYPNIKKIMVLYDNTTCIIQCREENSLTCIENNFNEIKFNVLTNTTYYFNIYVKKENNNICKLPNDLGFIGLGFMIVGISLLFINIILFCRIVKDAYKSEIDVYKSEIDVYKSERDVYKSERDVYKSEI